MNKETAPLATHDVGDPESLIEHRWGHAIQEWFAGRRGLLMAEILDPTVNIPSFAREFLGDLVAGTVKRPMGRPSKRTLASERSLVDEVFRKWTRFLETDSNDKESGIREGDPRMRAIQAVAERHELREDQLRGIVDKWRDEGYTRDFWERYLRAGSKSRDNESAGKVP